MLSATHAWLRGFFASLQNDKRIIQNDGAQRRSPDDRARWNLAPIMQGTP